MTTNGVVRLAYDTHAFCPSRRCVRCVRPDDLARPRWPDCLPRPAPSTRPCWETSSGVARTVRGRQSQHWPYGDPLGRSSTSIPATDDQSLCGSSLDARSWRRRPEALSRLRKHHGSRVIDADPPATDLRSPTSSARRHDRRVEARAAQPIDRRGGIDVGRPAKRIAIRPILRLSSPAPFALPQKTSPTRPGRSAVLQAIRPARSPRDRPVAHQRTHRRDGQKACVSRRRRTTPFVVISDSALRRSRGRRRSGRVTSRRKG